MNSTVQSIVSKYKKDRTRLLDILNDIQSEYGFISEDAVNYLAGELGMSAVDIEQTVSFYHFLSREPRGRYTVYLNNSLVARMMGMEEVAAAFIRETGCTFGSVTPDGLIGLFETSDIGMNDQEPAALINNVVFTRLTPYRVRELVRDMRNGKSVHDMFTECYGEGHNGSILVRAMVNNNIRRIGPILSGGTHAGDALKKIIQITPEAVIEEVKDSNLRGRGGAGFPTGLKWEFCRMAEEQQRYVFCNADEGEPGTFKDRVLLTQYPYLLFEGMTIAGYATGARLGILYLRYEYMYLEKYLNNILFELRDTNQLGKNILGKVGFDFDIRLQVGGGAYVCGEESALLESSEGKRGEPRDRPPFPVEKGYLGKPTVVNNVETLCAVVKIINHGNEWFRSFGTKDSSGTKLLSISGDCKYPGIYEVPWGLRIADLLGMAGADDCQAVQVGGPSGTLIGPADFDHYLSYADLATGGSMIIIGKQRDILKDVVLNFLSFFIDESCGSCSTCRNFPVIMRRTLLRIINGHGVRKDVEELLLLSKLLKMSRCGLGQTAGNPVATSLRNFRKLYEEKLLKDTEYVSEFDMKAAVQASADVVGRIVNLAELES